MNRKACLGCASARFSGPNEKHCVFSTIQPALVSLLLAAIISLSAVVSYMLAAVSSTLVAAARSIVIWFNCGSNAKRRDLALLATCMQVFFNSAVNSTLNTGPKYHCKIPATLIMLIDPTGYILQFWCRSTQEGTEVTIFAQPSKPCFTSWT